MTKMQDTSKAFNAARRRVKKEPSDFGFKSRGLDFALFYVRVGK